MNATREERTWPGWLAAVPVLALAWPGPGGFWADDPDPMGSLTGLSLLLFLPATIWLAWRPGRASIAGFAPLLLVAAIAATSSTRALTDAFELRRALVQVALVLVAHAVGTRLDKRELAAFALAAVAASLAFTGFALLESFASLDDAAAGVLGNTGTLSQAALPGAVIGAFWGIARRDWKQKLGAATALAFLFHAALVPVLAGTLAFTIALGFGACVMPRKASIPMQRTWLLGLALLALMSLFGRGFFDRADPSSTAGVGALPAADVGGVGVRGMIWQASTPLLLDHLALGVGPGQFRAEFPPYRDPDEIERSRHGACSGLDTEVEHPHSDWVAVFTENGALGGLAFLGFGLFMLGVAGRLAHRGELTALALAAVALLANASVHTPLTRHGPAAILAFVIFGALAQKAGPGRLAVPAFAARLVAAAALLVLGYAVGLVQHGRATSSYVTFLEKLVAAGSLAEEEARGGQLGTSATLRSAREAIDAALDAAPDSALALTLAARAERNPAAWEALLAVRPHSFEAWENLGLLHARSGEDASAIAAWHAALGVSPFHPRVSRNIVRLELEAGDMNTAFERIAHQVRQGCVEPGWTERLGFELFLSGWFEAGIATLAQVDDSWDTLLPEEAYASIDATEARGEAMRADVLTLFAHWSWARDHAEKGGFANAVRSYRQALRPTMKFIRPGAPAVLAELAAAELQAGRPDAARNTLGDALFSARVFEVLPAWARRAYLASELWPFEGPEPEELADAR